MLLGAEQRRDPSIVAGLLHPVAMVAVQDPVAAHVGHDLIDPLRLDGQPASRDHRLEDLEGLLLLIGYEHVFDSDQQFVAHPRVELRTDLVGPRRMGVAFADRVDHAFA